jgi:uncharacterized coiled-coil DUF342 family protein
VTDEEIKALNDERHDALVVENAELREERDTARAALLQLSKSVAEITTDADLLAELNTKLTIIQCIAEQAERIYVREQMNGKWDSYALTELPAALAIMHVLKFISEHRMPVVMVP